MFPKIPPIKFIHQISEGSFASVHLIEDQNTQLKYAIKIEHKELNSFDSISDSSLFIERAVLSQLDGINGVPKIIWFGKIQSKMAIMTELLGKDLKFYFEKLKNFSLGTVLKLSLALLEIIQNVHKNNIIHRDIKPENIMLGINENTSQVYLIDFNLAKFFKNSKNEHIKQKQTNEFNGNLHFSSVNSHLFQETSRKDDLEAIGYMLLYFLQGNLPWENFECKNVLDKVMKIGSIKQKFLNNIATKNSLNICSCFVEYFHYISTLNFNSEPNYEVLKNIFKEYALKKEIDLNMVQWDWETPKFKNKKIIFKLNKKYSADFFPNITKQNNNISLEEKTVKYTNENFNSSIMDEKYGENCTLEEKLKKMNLRFRSSF